MRPLVGPVPDPAEQASSALRRCSRATLTRGAAVHAVSLVHAVPLVHAEDGLADLVVVVRTADGRDAPSTGEWARLEVEDVVRGGAADGRCRRLVVVEGPVEVPDLPAQRRAATDIARELPDPALLDVGTAAVLVGLRPERIHLVDDDGVTEIDPDDLATSGPDHFADIEGMWLAHLNDSHCDVVGRIALRLGRCLPVERPLLVGIDRAGVDLEMVGRDGTTRRHRLPFAEACVSVADLGKQLRVLAGCPKSAAPLTARD